MSSVTFGILTGTVVHKIRYKLVAKILNHEVLGCYKCCVSHINNVMQPVADIHHTTYFHGKGMSTIQCRGVISFKIPWYYHMEIKHS